MPRNVDREETDLANTLYVGHLQLLMTRDVDRAETDLASKRKVMHPSLLTRPAAEWFFRGRTRPRRVAVAPYAFLDPLGPPYFPDPDLPP